MSTAVHVTGSNLTYVFIVLGISLVALAIAYGLRAQVLAQSDGTEKMKEIAAAVQEGAAAYLNRQFKTLSFFVAAVFVLLFALPGHADIRIGRSIFFLLGALFSAAVGYNGMWLAVRANVRVAEAARQKSAAGAVKIAFRTGGVVGMTTVGLGLLGASLVVLIYRENAPEVLEGFGFGAAMLAMFMRVGGGIFTKAADVGAGEPPQRTTATNHRNEPPQRTTGIYTSARELTEELHMPQLFDPITIRGLEVSNRAWVSPMCQYSAKDGVVGEWHMVHGRGPAPPINSLVWVTHGGDMVFMIAEERR